MIHKLPEAIPEQPAAQAYLYPRIDEVLPLPTTPKCWPLLENHPDVCKVLVPPANWMQSHLHISSALSMSVLDSI